MEIFNFLVIVSLVLNMLNMNNALTTSYIIRWSRIMVYVSLAIERIQGNLFPNYSIPYRIVKQWNISTDYLLL